MTSFTLPRFLRPLLSFLVLAAPVAAQDPAPKPEPPEFTFLWKVEKEGLATSFLLGTMHTPDPRINALHPAVKSALNEADAFYTEIKMDEMDSMQTKIMEIGMLPEGSTMEDLLGEESYADLAKILEPHGMPVGMLNRMRPFMVEMTVGQLELLPLLAKGGKPLDERLYAVAQHKGMEVGGVETFEEQIHVLAEVRTDEEVIFSLKTTLKKELARNPEEPSSLAQLTEIYLSGNESRMHQFTKEEMDFDIPGTERFFNALLPKRNVNMAVRSAKLMQDHPAKKYVFAFGALHFLGEDGVPQLLRNHGFTVTRMHAPVDNLTWVEDKEAMEGALQALGYSGD